MLTALAVLATASPAAAHEPIFGVGPRVIWKDGLGIEVELERDREASGGLWVLRYELLYGLTPDQALTLEVPYILEKRSAGESQAGVGDVLIRYKWRFFRKDVPGGVYQAALLGGVELPSGDPGATPTTGSGTRDLLAGLAVDYEGRRWLLFGAARFKRNGARSDGVEVGDVVLLDAALGLRPVKTGYLSPDAVLMAELNYESYGRWRRAGAALDDTGGRVLFLSFGVWFTYRNHALKPGIQVPLHTCLNGLQESPRWTAVVAYEFHLGSFLGR